MNEERTDLVTPEPRPEPAPKKPEPALLARLREVCVPVLLCAAAAGAGYAALFVKQEYRGLNVVLFSALWLALTWVSLRKLNVARPRSFLLLGGGVMALALCTFWTANRFVQGVNGVGIFLLMNLLLLDHFCPRKDWGFGETLGGLFRLFGRGLTCAARPFTHLTEKLRSGKEKKDHRKLRSILVGLVISLPLAWAALALLSSADSLFRAFSDQFLTWELPYTAEEIVSTVLQSLLAFACVGIGFYALLCGQCTAPADPRPPRERKRDPLVAVTFTAVLLGIYLLFCWFQIRYLFVGLIRNGAMELPYGKTFAGYARQGFFQLLAVSGGNLLLVLFCCSVFADSRALRALLTAVCATTYVMMASSAARMLLYTGEYGLTFQRLLVLWFLGTLAILFGGTVLYLYRRRFPLFRFFLTVGLVLWLAFGFARPDRIAAGYNLDRFGPAGKSGFSWSEAEELAYEFSWDAAPVAVRAAQMDEEVQRQLLQKHAYADKLQKTWQDGELRGFNLAVWEARRALNEADMLYSIPADRIRLQICLELEEDVGLLLVDCDVNGASGGTGGVSSADGSMLRRDDVLSWDLERSRLEMPQDTVTVTVRFTVVTKYFPPNYENDYPEEFQVHLEPISLKAEFGKTYTVSIHGGSEHGYRAVLTPQ